ALLRAAADQEFVKRAQRAKAQLNGGPAQFAAAEETEVTAEIIALQRVPRGRRFPCLLVPAEKFGQGLAIVALSVDRRAAIRRQVREESLDPWVVDFRISFVRSRLHRRL